MLASAVAPASLVKAKKADSLTADNSMWRNQSKQELATLLLQELKDDLRYLFETSIYELHQHIIPLFLWIIIRALQRDVYLESPILFDTVRLFNSLVTEETFDLILYKSLQKLYREIPYKSVNDLLKGVKKEETFEPPEEPSFIEIDGKEVVCKIQTTGT